MPIQVTITLADSGSWRRLQVALFLHLDRRLMGVRRSHEKARGRARDRLAVELAELEAQMAAVVRPTSSEG